MKKPFLVILQSVIALSAGNALNLQPREVMVEQDGPPMRRYYFADEAKKILFRIDGRMSVSGSATQAVFHFSDIRNSTTRLTRSTMKPDVTFDPKNLELYRSMARGSVPAQANDVQIVEEKSDAIPINNWASHQFVFTYKLFGVSYRQSITFFNYSETEQLVFDVLSEEGEYEKTYSRSYRVINSFSDYIPGQASGPS